MTNSAIGDALTDLLLVVSCLNYLEWGLKEWSGIYQEWLSKLTKAKVKDRYILKVLMYFSKQFFSELKFFVWAIEFDIQNNREFLNLFIEKFALLFEKLAYF